MDDLFMMEDGGDDETDWLDVWMGSLAVERCSEMRKYVVEEEQAMDLRSWRGRTGTWTSRHGW